MPISSPPDYEIDDAIAAARDTVREPKKLQFLRDKNTFRLSCGRWINKAGKTKERVFTLGANEAYARCLALALRRWWAGLVARETLQGNPTPLWSESEVAGAVDEADEMFRVSRGLSSARSLEMPPVPEWVPVIVEESPAAPVVKKNLVTLKDATDAYVRFLGSRKLAKSNSTRQAESMANLLRNVDPATRLSDLTFEKLSAITTVYKNRPLKKDGQKMEVGGAKTVMQHFRQMLTFLENESYWLGPRRWEKAIEFKVSAEATPTERRKMKSAVIVFTPAEIGTLWRACVSPADRAILMFGLNFAATQQQIASLQKGDCQADHLHLYRSKTHVEVFYDYFPETKKAVEHFKARTANTADDLLMISANGKPMVHFSVNGHKTDNVKLIWNRMLSRTDLPDDRRLSFAALRDTTSNAMLKRCGEAIQSQVLAHAPNSVAGRHYTERRERSDFEMMNQHMAAWYREVLQPEMTKVLPVKAAS